MKFGLHGINIGSYSSPELMTEVAQAAEAAGFDSVWTGEHTVLPERGWYMPAASLFLDSLVALTYLAATTSTLKLATGVLILPQHHPLVLAKAIASLDHLSGGRVLAGFGVGYLQPEFQALGVPFEDRGARTEEYLEAMLAIWSQDEPQYDGHYVSFKQVQAYPRPLQQPSPPIIFGGSALPALRRTLQYAHGWYGWSLNLEKIQQFITQFHQLEQEVTRPAQLGPLEISVHLRVSVTAALVEQLDALGVQRIVLSLPDPADKQTALRFIEQTSKTLFQREKP
jgi:probable F420-dependent oxidoreductase